MSPGHISDHCPVYSASLCYPLPWAHGRCYSSQVQCSDVRDRQGLALNVGVDRSPLPSSC
jgi:hypothetical protein